MGQNQSKQSKCERKPPSILQLEAMVGRNIRRRTYNIAERFTYPRITAGSTVFLLSVDDEKIIVRFKGEVVQLDAKFWADGHWEPETSRKVNPKEVSCIKLEDCVWPEECRTWFEACPKRIENIDK